MKSTDIQQINTTEQIRSCYQVMRQLRPHLTNEQAFVEQIKRQIAEGYKLICFQDEEKVRAVAGYRFLECLAWGKILYIDDLITDAEARRNGHGTTLLKWIIDQAKKANCDQVHLDSGPHSYDAHRLYLNHGFKIVAHHFGLDFKE